MTTTYPVTPVAAHDPEEAIAAVRARGLRASSARRLLIEALFAAEQPLTAEEIAAGAGGPAPGGDVGSIYRNLELLESIGLVRHVHLGHGPSRYAPAGSIPPAYAVCERCGEQRAVSDAELEPVRDAVRRQLGLEARFSHFPIVGICSDCEPAPAEGDG